VFGLQDPEDPALAVVERLRERFPWVPMDVVVDRTQHGSNRKIGNLINMMPYARHEILVIGDSDMHVAPDYLRRLVATLEQPGVGLATTLYAGWPASESLAAKLGAANINHAFLPGALLARAMGRQDCLGATMALTRTTLERVGGLHALADQLADDAVLGRLVQRLGLSVQLAGAIPATTVPETQMPALIQHELRWARTIKSLVPLEFAASSMQHPLFWAALAVGVSGGAGWAWMLFAGAWMARALMAHAIDRDLKIASALTIWFLPLRDILSVSVILASYRSRKVAWRGTVLMATRPSLEPGKG
jgi:ceramide glucosyltransferase